MGPWLSRGHGRTEHRTLARRFGETAPARARNSSVGHNPRSVRNENRLSEYGNERDQDAFWEAIRPADEPLRHRWFLPVVVVVLAISVPWYLPDPVGGRLIGGLPVWTWITIACGFVLAVVTAFASLRLWRDGGGEGPDDAGEEAPAGPPGDAR